MKTKFEIYQQIFEDSRDEKHGLTLYFSGLSIAGVITKIIGTDAVEMQSREFSRITVCIEAIDAITVG